MVKILCILIITNFILQSCNFIKQPILSKNSEFDLEAIDFQENIPKLYSKHILNADGYEYDSIRDGKLADEKLKYKISNIYTEAMELEIPQKDFGYLYKSPLLDSIAKFQNIYFESISALTNKNKKPVAYYAESIFTNVKQRNISIDEISKKYGKPTYAFFIGNGFNVCAYEWDLTDKTIQVETSFAHSASINTDGDTNNGKYYRLAMLIINNTYKNDIYKAHVYICPEKLKVNGKYYTKKELNLEKNEIVKDDFLLYSTDEDYIKNENGEYDISRAENEE